MAVPLVTCACAGFGSSAVDSQPKVVSDPNVYPAEYRLEILAFLRTYLNDPTRIRSASVAEPALIPTRLGSRYGVCLRFNARKPSGDYEGVRERVVYFLSGKLDAMAEARPEDCAKAAWQPFPELERLTR